LEVRLKVLKSAYGTNVFLANLSDEEVLALRPAKSTVRVIPRNWMAAPGFYTNGLDLLRITYRPDSENPSVTAFQTIGTNALPGLLAGLREHDSRAVDFYNLHIWPKLSDRLQAAVGRPIHPAHWRVNSAYAIGTFGPAAKPAIPELRKLLVDTNYMVRAAALEALQRIEPTVVEPFHPDLFFSQSEMAENKLRASAGPSDTSSLAGFSAGFFSPGSKALDSMTEEELAVRRERSRLTGAVRVPSSIWKPEAGLPPDLTK